MWYYGAVGLGGAFRRAVSRAVVGLVLGLASILLLPSFARADERASAEELFQRGRQAMDRKDYARACDLLEASLRLEDTLGTLLNVALCHEAQGRVATAWGEFRAVEQRALRTTPPQTGRAELARQHAADLSGKLPRLRVTLDPKNDARVVDISVDDRSMATEALLEGTPVDPGRRTVKVSAPKKLPLQLTVDIPSGPSTTPLAIPALADAPKPKPTANLQDVEAVAAARSRRAAGFVVGGIGLAFLAAGGVLGAFALNARSEATCQETEIQGVRGCFATVRTESLREVPNPELERARDAYDDATVFANLSTGAFALGAIGVGVGVYLVLTAKVPSATATLRLRPSPLGLGAAF